MTYLSGGMLSSAPSRKRNVFFSFHYADIMRVMNVQKSQEFKTQNRLLSSDRSIEGFYNYSLWEKTKIEGEDALRRMIREGVERTSAVCVLVGTHTWSRPWVRYEVARSVIDGRGLFAVHINGLRHHEFPFQPHPLGSNPCASMGLSRRTNGNYYLVELARFGNVMTWAWYEKSTSAVPLPVYMPEMAIGATRSLSAHTETHDWMDNGHNNIGWWIDEAARQAGR